jgi:hypothetical protein
MITASPGSQRRSLKRSFVVLGCAALVAACGSSSGGKAADTSSHFAGAIKFSICMRSHGVPNFPDPTSHGGGIQLNITPGSGISPFSPAFKAAQAACQKLMPGGGPGGAGPPSAAARAQFFAIAKCMRAHGLSDFPDPTTTQPGGGPAGFSLVMGGGGVFLAVPRSIDPQSPAFKHAAAACHFGGP